MSIVEDIDFHEELAYKIYLRWNKDIESAHCAWKRLFQNNCSLESFKSLVESYLKRKIENL